MVIDTHAHINDEVYSDLEQIIENMQQDNLEKIVIASADYKGSKRAIELANIHKNLYAMIGIHPDNSSEFTDLVRQFIINNGTNKKVVAIGEIGLDYHSASFDKQSQQKIFIEQLQLANRLNLPVVIHVRDAYEDMLNILKQNKNLITNGGIIHCFSGSYEIALEFIKLGFKIAFGGVLTFKNAKKAVDSASKIPLENLVVETDCPWLCPEPHRGERNQPKYVNFVVQKLADIKQMSKNELEKILLDNTYNVLKKMER